MTIRSRFFPDRVDRPLYENSLWDDFLFAHPLNTAMRLVRLLGSRRRVRSSGVSVIIVNWNTRDVLRVAMEAVRTHSPADTELIVVDNHSSDGSREWLRTRPLRSRVVLLPFNIGHGRALDVGLALARSPIVVTLDSDAFPYAPTWLETLCDPINNGTATAAGMWGRRDRLHPACAAYRRDACIGSRLSFSSFSVRGSDEELFGVNTWDTGELLAQRLGAGAIILPTRDEPYGGWTVADVAYHHGGFSRHLEDDGATDSERWDAAVAAFLGDDPSSVRSRRGTEQGSDAGHALDERAADR